MKRVPSPESVPPLTSEEQRIIAVFRNIAPSYKKGVLQLMEEVASTDAKRSGTPLRLVAGGAA